MGAWTKIQLEERVKSTSGERGFPRQLTFLGQSAAVCAVTIQSKSQPRYEYNCN